jgi:hypothetical protein
MFMKEDEDSLCSGSQQMMSSVDDAFSDIKQQALLVPEVIVSCSVFVFNVGRSVTKSGIHHSRNTEYTMQTF